MRIKLAGIILSLIFAISAAAPVSVLAVEEGYGIGTTAGEAGLKDLSISTKSVPQLVGQVVAWLMEFLGIIFFILALYAGFTWMTARGNTEEIDKAKEILQASIIGILIVLAAYAITSYVLSGLGAATGGGNNSQPVSSARECAGKRDGERCSEDGGTQCIAQNCVETCENMFPGKNPSCQRTGACISPRISYSGVCTGGNDVQCCHDP